MCAPCKIIFNQGAQQAVDTATLMREEALKACEGKPERDGALDGFLYSLAEAEAEFCERVRALKPHFAQLVGASVLWQELMQR